MSIRTRLFSCFICVLATVVFAYDSYAAMPVNPRATDSGSSPRSSTSENTSRRVTSTTRVRSVLPTRVTGVARGALTNAATRSPVSGTRVRVRSGTVIPVTASRVARSAKTNARVGKSTVFTPTGLSRSAKARATALFNDVNKIGSGYANCRESYATCMDQICGQANDTYRRCFCSSRFTQFRNTENALDQAMIMLQQFQDNNLEAIDKTAEEVNAMYSATVGEQAIKKDTSASAKMLDDISKLLSGKTTVATSSTGSGSSVGVLDLNFSSDIDDIWSGGGTDSLFSTSGGKDLSTLEGAALFSEAQKQCSRLSQGTCENDAVFSMSKSSYNILITQDCNAYEKNLSKKRETVAQAIRTAEKYLREARLEEYRSHNSADVNECLAKVREAMLADTACGDKYKRCLDPTGAFINGSTGEAIYSPRLFKLEETINLYGDISGDVLTDNPDYDRYLENYRKYVTRELDTCRDISDFVWTEFKRNAIIEIAQAQTEKIEEVKMSCVETMGQCYDTQTQSLVGFDQKTATAAGALGRYVARDMCHEKVMACATLWNTSGQDCEFDARGHLTNEANCGLQSLLDYVSTVDTMNVAEKCGEALDEYIDKLCSSDNEKYEGPFKCRLRTPVDLQKLIIDYAVQNCWDPSAGNEKSYEKLDVKIQSRVESVMENLNASIRAMLSGICESLDGHWYDSGRSQNSDEAKIFTKFYNDVYGRGTSNRDSDAWGSCWENTRKDRCLAYNSEPTTDDDGNTIQNIVATWDDGREMCKFTDTWYKDRCEAIGGYYDRDTCYIQQQ